jgi:hypothetical protein
MLFQRLSALLFLVVVTAAAPASAVPAPESAAVVAKRCSSADQGKERDCYAAALESRLGAGPTPALELLGALAVLDEDVRRDGHMYAHRIGIAALTTPADVSKVFASCTPSWQSGCYHGVIQSYFLLTERAGGGIDAKSVDALCGDYRGARADLLFQCTHGLGHGLEMLQRYDLPKALASCDLLSRNEEQEMCHAGAFMENIVNATQPHSTAPAAGAAMDHGHGMHMMAQAAFKQLDPNDMHYPCSVVGERYMIGCYTIQTSAMLHHAKNDAAIVGGECGRAPAKARPTCFLSFGRDVSVLSAGKEAEAIRLCTLADATFRPMCHRGVVESLVNMNANPAEGIAYCKAVPEADGKTACYTAIGNQALVLPKGEALRAQACRLAEDGMRDVCLGERRAGSGF